MKPQVSLVVSSPREIRQDMWDSLVPQSRGGLMRNYFDDDFFEWIRGQIPMIEDFTYARMEYTGDSKMIFPFGT